jgi:hypothetical protein
MFFNEVTGRFDGTTATGTALGTGEFDYEGTQPQVLEWPANLDRFSRSMIADESPLSELRPESGPPPPAL